MNIFRINDLIVGNVASRFNHFSPLHFSVILQMKFSWENNNAIYPPCIYLFTGKTTILKILGGKHMVEPQMVRVLGRSAFHDTPLTSSGDLCYLGGEVCLFVCFFFPFHSPYRIWHCWILWYHFTANSFCLKNCPKLVTDLQGLVGIIAGSFEL